MNENTNRNTPNTETRLAFVNPNASYNTINGSPLTPPYEDMCISVNLEIEVVNRTKTNNVGYNQNGVGNNLYMMSWISNYKVDESGNFIGETKDIQPIYFMQGRDAQEYSDGLTKEKYLTTYYTDISLNDIRNRNIVEGLGISNIDISYDNMYMPTVTINFVDVRGSSIFGREEEVHNGSNKITSETIFGCFFTLPYPKFKLHVKGFFGNAVTYQLACTGFKGRFNSQTGNFEITTTFIGYQYSLLTDIPFIYLITAPYCEYVGAEYWKRHVKTPQWQLSNGKEMKKLYEMYIGLKRELKEGLNTSKIATAVDLSSVDVAINQLIEMWKDIKELIKARCTYFGYKQQDEAYKDKKTNELHFLCMCSDEMIIYDNMIGHKLANLQIEVDKFNSSFKDKNISFKIPANFVSNTNRKAVKLVEYIEKENNVVICRETGAIFACKELKEFIKSKIKQEKPNNYVFFKDKQYGYEFSDGGFEYSINYIVEGIKTAKEEENEQAKNNDYVPEEITNALGFKPSIGNFFKIIIAHLETFTAMMYKCVDVILGQMRNGDRLPANLGVSFDNTDVEPNVKFIPPFPAVYKKDVNTSEVDGGNSIYNALGWVGDFSPNFEEEKLIISIFNAAQRIVDISAPITTQSNFNISNLFPSIPFEIYNRNSMSKLNQYSVDMISALLGIRMTQIFGILNNGELTDTNIAAEHGRMDAINFFQSIQNKDTLRNLLYTENTISSNTSTKYTSKQQIVYNIMQCLKDNESETYARLDKNSNIQGYNFEYYSYGKKGDYLYQDNPRFVHPVIYNDKDKTKYTYIWGGYNDGKEFGIVPTHMQTISNIFGKIVFNNGKQSKQHNIPLNNIKVDELNEYGYKTTDSVLHTVSSKEFLGNEDSKSYLNESMFKIITNQDEVKSICDRCNVLNNDNIKVNGYSGGVKNFKKIIDRYYDLDITKYLQSNKKQYLAKIKTDKLINNKIDKTKINTTLRQFEISVGETFETINQKLEFISIEDAYKSRDLSEYFVPYCLCNCQSQNQNDKKRMSLDITTAFLNYYNEIKDRDFVNILKCWLLIQTVPLNWLKTKEILQPINKHGSIKKVPLAMVLLLGGAIHLSRRIIKISGKENLIPNTTQPLKKDNIPDCFQNFSYTFSDALIDENNVNANYVKDNGWKTYDLYGPSRYKGLYSFINPKSSIHTDEYIFKTFLEKDKDDNYSLHLTNIKNSTLFSNCLTFNEIFGGKGDDKWLPDTLIANELEKVFIDWYNSKGNKMIRQMVSSNDISWGAYENMFKEMQTIYNEHKYVKESANVHVKKAWTNYDLNSYYNKPNQIVLDYVPNLNNLYCNYFTNVWNKTTFNYWCNLWDETWHPSDDSNINFTNDTIRKKCVELYSGRFPCTKNTQRNWCEFDYHWLAVNNKGNDFIAYWQSNAPFMPELLELYTGSCLVCLTSPNVTEEFYNIVEETL